MPLSAAAEKELRKILQSYGAAHSGAMVPSGQGKALEAWVLLKLAETAKMIPAWRVSLRRGDNSVLPVGSAFQLSNQHTPIRPSAPSAPGFVHLQHLKQPELEFELHCSLQWCGRSGARHECDISLIPATIAQALRNHGGGFPHGLPIAAVECKDRTQIGTLDETRQTIARMFDLALVTRPVPGLSCRIYEDKTGSHWGRRSSQYVAFFAKGTFGIVRAGGSQSGAQILADHYHVKHFTSVYSKPNTVKSLQSQFRQTLYQISNF